MNTIRQIQELNKRELEQGITPEGSWHADYRDTAYIYIGGLSFDLSEGDILTIFSQYGEPVFVNLVRDKETGKSKGFAFLKYEDQRSCDLAVDNLGGATVLGRVLRVDHTRYKKKEGEEEKGIDVGALEAAAAGKGGRGQSPGASDSEGDNEPPRPLLKEERDLAALLRDHDDDDPMKAYLVQQKRDEVAEAIAAYKAQASASTAGSKKKSRRHHADDDDDDDDRKRRHHHRSSRRDRDRDRDRDDEDRSRRHRDRSRERHSHSRRHRTRSPDEKRERERERDREGSRSRKDRDRDRARQRSSSRQRQHRQARSRSPS